MKAPKALFGISRRDMFGLSGQFGPSRAGAWQAADEAGLIKTVGFSDPQMSGMLFAAPGLRPASLADEEIRIAEEMCAPAFTPGPWAQWRERLDNRAWGIDTCQAIHDVAREIPQHMLPENVQPRRWYRVA